jgi:hypothetical protein
MITVWSLTWDSAVCLLLCSFTPKQSYRFWESQFEDKLVNKRLQYRLLIGTWKCQRTKSHAFSFFLSFLPRSFFLCRHFCFRYERPSFKINNCLGWFEQRRGRLAFLFIQISDVRSAFRISSFQTLLCAPLHVTPLFCPSPTSTTSAPVLPFANDLLRQYDNLSTPASSIPSFFQTELCTTRGHHQNQSNIKHKRSKSERPGPGLSLERSTDLFWAVVISVWPYLVLPLTQFRACHTWTRCNHNWLRRFPLSIFEWHLGFTALDLWILQFIATQFRFLVYDDDSSDIKRVWKPEAPRNTSPAHREERRVLRRPNDI